MTAPITAQITRDAERGSTRSNPASNSQAGTSSADIEQVRVTRASYYLGSDVMSTDGRKVGDIVDYYVDLSRPSHLAYIVVMTGGFLEFGGDRRAVPASAITTSGDACRINISSGEYWNIPILPDDAQRFVSDPQNQRAI